MASKSPRKERAGKGADAPEATTTRIPPQEPTVSRRRTVTMVSFGLEKAVREIMAAQVGQGISPAQMRVLIMHEYIDLGNVADAMRAAAAESAGRPGGEDGASRGGLEPQAVAEDRARATDVFVRILEASRDLPASMAAGFSPLLSVRDAILAVLRGSGEPMLPADIQPRTAVFLGFIPMNGAFFDALDDLEQGGRIARLNDGRYQLTGP